MPRYVFSPEAELDIKSILLWTHERFGEIGRMRYEALLIRAVQDVGQDPGLAGSHVRAEISPRARTYHLYHSRNRVDAASGRVRRPRHFLLYRIRDDGQVEIGRVLHDSMELKRHLPDRYRLRPDGRDAPE